jgi:uncharacterized protein YecE (DUF72 family)
MKFGQVDDPDSIDFTIPKDRPDTKRILAKSKKQDFKVFVGCAKWNKTDLKNFYPKGVKDELGYYASHFNCVELNATFYKRYWEKQYTAWHDGVPDGFLFFPKLPQSITHFSRLKDVEEKVAQFAENSAFLKGKLGMPFMQMHNNFDPKDFERVERFIECWKQYARPLAMEFRKTNWHTDPEISSRLYALMESNNITNVLVDTAGRRDLMHMRLTTPTPFVRWVGANHRSDRDRLDEWVARIAKWKKLGLSEIYFFIHQNVEKESPFLSAYFIEKLNKKVGTKLRAPATVP